MLFGHKKIWEFFLNSKSTLSHIYLFSGEEKIGKKKMALEIAKLLNCLNLEKNPIYKEYPCLKCKNCIDIEKNQFPDLFILEKDKEKRDIDIEKIRDLKKNLSFKPYNSKQKIAIIDDAHLMNISSQNALLKTLEEPFGFGETIIFLITDKPKQLLETILSRVQKVKFFNLSQEEIKNYLSKRDMSRERAEEIENFSLGKLGIAIDFINNPEKLIIYKTKIKELKTIIDSPLYLRFDYVKKIIDDKNGDMDILELLILWMSYFQSLLLLEDDNKKTKKILRRLTKTYTLVSTININKKLALENLVLEF